MLGSAPPACYAQCMAATGEIAPFDRLSPHDLMVDGGLPEYLRAGELALSLCRAALAGRTVRRIVDFPSGHGRVMRWLRQQWPEAELFGVEIDPDALAFVSETFGAITIRSNPALDMPLPQEVDLIFSGSLLTHLAAPLWDTFFRSCLDALATDGILVFTTHGRIAALLAEERHAVYGTLVDTAALHREYLESGFSYRNYDDAYPTYGLSLSAPEWVLQRLAAFPVARIAHFEEGGWGHQDVFAVRKNPWPLARNVVSADTLIRSR